MIALLFRAWEGFRVWGLEFRVQVEGLGLRVWRLGIGD